MSATIQIVTDAPLYDADGRDQYGRRGWVPHYYTSAPESPTMPALAALIEVALRRAGGGRPVAADARQAARVALPLIRRGVVEMVVRGTTVVIA